MQNGTSYHMTLADSDCDSGLRAGKLWSGRGEMEGGGFSTTISNQQQRVDAQQRIKLFV